MDRPAILAIDQLRAGYEQDIEILKGVTLQVPEGSVTGIIGPNGAGKSTILKATAGLIRPWSGTITVSGQRVEHLETRHRLKAGIAYVPQEDSLFPQMSVTDNLGLAGWIATGGDAKLVQERMEQVFDKFPVLREKRQHKVTTLSGGQQKLVEMGRALMAAPVLLLLDEPTAGLSPKLAAEVYHEIVKLSAGGISILLVDQNVRWALRICHHVYLIDMGANRDDGPPDHFQSYLEARGLSAWTGTKATTGR